MSYLESFESIISEIKKSISKDEIKFVFVTQDQKVLENLDDIIKIVGNNKTRFGSLKRYSITIRNGETNLIFFHISEFPSCCGKLIAHGIVLRKIYYESYRETFTFNDKQYSEMVSIFLELLKLICEMAGYSSVDYILSDTDNADLYKEHKDKSMKPTISWRNKRYETGHNCSNYTIVL